MPASPSFLPILPEGCFREAWLSGDKLQVCTTTLTILDESIVHVVMWLKKAYSRSSCQNYFLTTLDESIVRVGMRLK